MKLNKILIILIVLAALFSLIFLHFIAQSVIKEVGYNPNSGNKIYLIFNHDNNVCVYLNDDKYGGKYNLTLYKKFSENNYPLFSYSNDIKNNDLNFKNCVPLKDKKFNVINNEIYILNLITQTKNNTSYISYSTNFCLKNNKLYQEDDMTSCGWD